MQCPECENYFGWDGVEDECIEPNDEFDCPRCRGLKPNGTKTYYKDFLPMSMGALNAITMKIKMQYYKRSYWNILFRTKMKDARKNLIR